MLSVQRKLLTVNHVYNVLNMVWETGEHPERSWVCVSVHQVLSAGHAGLHT